MYTEHIDFTQCLDLFNKLVESAKSSLGHRLAEQYSRNHIESTKQQVIRTFKSYESYKHQLKSILSSDQHNVWQRQGYTRSWYFEDRCEARGAMEGTNDKGQLQVRQGFRGVLHVQERYCYVIYQKGCVEVFRVCHMTCH